METPSPPAKRADGSALPAPQVLALSPSDRRSAEDEAEATRRRLWRRRRVEKFESLRTQVSQMEKIALALRLKDDADEIWDAFLDDETRRMRGALRRLTPAAREVQMLLSQQRQLQQLLAEHKLSCEVLQATITEDSTGDWDTCVARWRRIARDYFIPWKAEQCVAELNTAMVEAHRFAVSRDKQSTGLTFMGWEDSRRVDPDGSAFHFSIHKTYRGYDLDRQISGGWRVYTESALYTRVILSGRGRAYVDVLQQLTPLLFVVLYHERYDGMEGDFHTLAILATIDTDERVTIFLRSIEAPDLMRAFDRATDHWVSKFYWKQFDILDRTKPRTNTDFRAAMRGTIRDMNLEYVNLWLFEVLVVLVRSEPLATGRSLLKF